MDAHGVHPQSWKLQLKTDMVRNPLTTTLFCGAETTQVNAEE